MESILEIISGLFETRLASWIYVLGLLLFVVGVIFLTKASSILVILASFLLLLLGAFIVFLQIRKDYSEIRKK